MVCNALTFKGKKKPHLLICIYVESSGRPINMLFPLALEVTDDVQV
jgi:hypothetical protein